MSDGPGDAVRVVIADRDPRVRALIKFNLTVREDAVVIGEAGEGLEAAALVEYGKPDLLIIDERLVESIDLLTSAGTRVIQLGDESHEGVVDKKDALRSLADWASSIIGG